MKILKSFCIAAGITIAVPLSAGAATILNIFGDDQVEELRRGSADNDGLALVFELFQDVADTSISIPTLCISGRCDLEVVLTNRNAFESTSFGSVIGFTEAVGGGTITPFSGLDLSAGVYSLVLTVQLRNVDPNDPGGIFGWVGTQPPAEGATSDYGAFVAAGSIGNGLVPGEVPWFDLTTLDGFVPGVTVLGDLAPAPAPVPLPAAAWLLLGAVGTLVALRRRASRSNF